MSTKLVGDAWESVKKQKDLIKHSFKKYGLSRNLDSGEDALINIKNIVGYKMPLPERSSRWSNKLSMKMMIITINLKSRVQSPTQTRSNIVHVMYILLHLNDIWKKGFIFNARKRSQISLPPRISPSFHPPHG